MSLKNPNLADRHIGYKLKLQRTNLGMSQEALADRLSLSFQQIQKYEKGTNRISASRLYDLSQILDVEVSFFFEDLNTDYNAISGMSESAPVPVFMDFVSSNEGVSLNRSFTRIRSRRVRRAILELTRALADDALFEEDSSEDSS